MTSGSDKKDSKKKSKKKSKAEKETGSVDSFNEVPVLFSLDLVAFPGVVMSLYVENEKSQRAVDEAVEGNGLVVVLAHSANNPEITDIDNLYRVGVLAKVSKKLQLADGRYKVLLQGNERVRIEEFIQSDVSVMARVELMMSSSDAVFGPEEQAVIERIHSNLHVLVEYEHLPEEMLLVVEELDDPAQLADVLIAHYKLEIEDAQRMLEETDPVVRLHFTDKIIANDLSQLSVSENIIEKTREEMSKGQREYFLKEQLRQIQRELGDDDDNPDELSALKEALYSKKLPPHALKEAERQLSRLDRMNVESSEYAMLRTYLEWLSDLPWSKCTRDRLRIDTAEKILDEDHYGLKKAKERILEFLSVRKLKRDSHGPILCFVGPPGVGKTSLGKSIARCLNREFIRISLGGMRDEAEIRGHRRTYVGALPGRIIQGLKEAGSSNPVILLDELDKVGSDFRGDPASALLEILDPQQNKDFRDHYLNINYDLSRCLFIATANTTDTIPGALLDRLEVIRISGYTAEEKLDIARRYIIPRQVKSQGLSKLHIKFSDEAVLFLVERYTREAGVRNLERQVAAICRKIARLHVQKEKLKKRITPDLVRKYLGPTVYDPEVDERESIVGLCRGLAWTIHGGEVMPVETSIAKGKGVLTLTGHLGDVMQESAQAAVFYARSNADRLGLDPDFHKKVDIHIHVPSAATPKDGPSAGITIVTALVSVLTNRPVNKDIAMTGEITLRGAVLPIGGLKEKALAALRYGINKVIIPFENVKDLEDIPEGQRDQLEFIPVRHVSEVLERALMKSVQNKSQSKAKEKKSRKIKGKLIVEN